MFKNKIKFIRSIVAFILILVLTFNANNAFAESVLLEIHVGNDYEVKNILTENEKARTYKYWDLSRKYSVSDDRVKLGDELYKMSDAQLDSMFPSYEAVGKYEDGKISISGIKDGLYYFRSVAETRKFKYFSSFVAELSSRKSEKVEVFNKHKIIPFENGRVRLIKSDQYGNKLSHVGFKLYEIKDGKEIGVPLIAGYQYDENGKKDLTLYTDEKGEINVINLPFGKYIFREVEALKGYLVKNPNVEFTINSDSLVEINVENIKPEIGRYEFLKISDDAEQTRLSGAKFEIYKLENGIYVPFLQNGHNVVLESGADGKFVLENAPYGKYQIKEVKAPSGYILSTNPIDFEVNKDSGNKVLVIKNKKDVPPTPPFTGDRGVMIYIILGILALVLFVILYVVKRKNSK
ncbi:MULTISPECIES: SpaA isopeptide-forming pilin-related protein [Helcococcus]|uniref:SpaA isopeptide-forming pilin-related protein n=1 Tax=Helcococcus bovis TaxID=3153252 RepID=A0ABW9F675_9FIRM